MQQRAVVIQFTCTAAYAMKLLYSIVQQQDFFMGVLLFFWFCTNSVVCCANWIDTGFTCKSLESLDGDTEYDSAHEPGTSDAANIVFEIENENGQPCCPQFGICELNS